MTPARGPCHGLLGDFAFRVDVSLKPRWWCRDQLVASRLRASAMCRLPPLTQREGVRREPRAFLRFRAGFIWGRGLRWSRMARRKPAKVQEKDRLPQQETVRPSMRSFALLAALAVLPLLAAPALLRRDGRRPRARPGRRRLAVHGPRRAAGSAGRVCGRVPAFGGDGGDRVGSPGPHRHHLCGVVGTAKSGHRHSLDRARRRGRGPRPSQGGSPPGRRPATAARRYREACSSPPPPSWPMSMWVSAR